MLKQTALIDEHRRLGGRLIDFGGWELPVQYTGVMDEHQACRESIGLFDVSHMGEVTAEGPDAEKYLNHLLTNNISKLAVGQALYTVMCQEDGGIIDDLLVYRRGQESFFIVVNASNTEKDFAWMKDVLEKGRSRFSGVELRNASREWSQIAIQGRNAEKALQKLTQARLDEVKYYWFTEDNVLGSVPAILARTGYTGEDGFEVYVPWEKGPEVWRALLESGQEYGIKPCGLGARDTLRLEMKFPLYGHELSEKTNPIEAGLGWVVKLAKDSFVGREPIQKMKEAGAPRALVGLKLLGRGIPRQGYVVFDKAGETPLGEVTSGTQSPSLKEAIAIAYVEPASSAVGTEITVDIRGNKVPAQIVATPFYKRPY